MEVCQSLGAVLQKPETFFLQSKRLGSDDVSQTSKTIFSKWLYGTIWWQNLCSLRERLLPATVFCPENKVPLNKRLHEYLMSISDKAKVRSVIMALLKTCMNIIRAATKIYFKLKKIIFKHHIFTEPTEMSSKYFV